MADLIKKKMIDIVRSASKRVENKSVQEDFKDLDRKIGKQLEEKIERFEKKKEEQFKKEDGEKEIKKKRFSSATYVLLGLFLILLGGVVYSAIEFLPKAKIQITTKKTDWNYIEAVVAAKNIASVDIGQKQIPAEVFSVRKNFNFSFAATGKKQVKRKAGGKIIIYNSYGSGSQTLVAGTRFQSPDGKIFKLLERIVVPGAQIIEGKIVSSNIEAAVEAAQFGPQYNIGPISRFSIPGFQGTPKERGFYAESKEAMKGGFIGEAAYPTDEDIKKAKEKAGKDLKDYVDSYLSLQIPPEFKFIDASRQFNIIKEEVNPSTDEKGNFTVFIEGESLVIGFREADLISLIEETAQTNLGESFKIKNYQLEYGVGRPDFKKGQISFAVNFKGVFEEPIDIESFKRKVSGKDEKELKTFISSFPNIQKTTVSFWPFWVKKTPDNLKRITVEIK
ncbi:MAG: hypothetical protein DDT18_01887 [Actinobacteria bacterium]|nr:hypothetical protein [Actinomycetota bacterium]